VDWGQGRQLHLIISFHVMERHLQAKEGRWAGSERSTIGQQSLIVNATWKVAAGTNSFILAILKAKYFHNTSFWLASNTSTQSTFWSSILQVKDILI